MATDKELISREDLLAKYDRVHIGKPGKARKLIEDAPTVDAKPVVRGRWISLEPEIGLFECSKCGHKILRAECNYCPNCGADMRGDQDGT